MKNVLFLTLTLFTVASYNSQRIKIYHYNNSKVDGGEIYCNDMKAFYNKKNANIHVFFLYSKKLQKELTIINKLVEFSKKNHEDEDCYGYLNYAFISKRDTLYSDYELRYWRYKNKGAIYQLSEKARKEIKKD